MAMVTTKLVTAEEFYDWANRPENWHRWCELERGKIVETTRQGKRGGVVCGNAAGLLGNYTAACKKGYVCICGTGVIVERDPDTVRGPDIMLFEDVTTYEQLEEGFGAMPPLLSVEVLSPNDTMGKLLRRIREQLRFGTRLVWVIDPDARNVIVYQPGKEERLVEEHEELICEDVLPGFRCLVAEFFRLPGQQS